MNGGRIYCFAGEVASALRVADACLINVDAKSGMEVGTEIGWYNALDAGLPRAFFINKCDDPDADFDKVFEQLRNEFGNALCPVFIPIKEANGVTMADLMTMKCFRYLPNGERQEEDMTPSRRAVAEKYGLPVITDARLVEQNYGIYEGMDRQTPGFLANKRHFAYRYPGGESMMDVCHRIYGLLEDIKREHDGKNVLLVCHGGVMRLIRSYFEDMTNDEYFNYNIDNATPVLYEL